MAHETLDPDHPLGEPGTANRFLAIYEIGRQLLQEREPQQVIQAILRALVDHLRPDHACVLAVDADGAFRPLAAHALDLTAPLDSWPLSHTVLQHARTEGVAVLSRDSASDKRLSEADSVKRLRIHSVMCVPLGRRPVRGLVYVDNRTRRPFTRDDLDFLTAVSLYASLVLERAEEYARLHQALERSDERLGLLQGELLRHDIVGGSAALLSAYDTLRRFARAGARVLLRGETGTGKELFARAYAANGPRRDGPWVPVPIPALAPTLVESELFGHVRGAFTEARTDKKGRLEVAAGGVLFLDEVGDVDPQVQPKLLRFLDSGELVRVGDTAVRRVDALLVSATNRTLERDVEAGRFRSDLLARLGQVVHIPPLRERADDVPLLVAHFLERHRRAGRAKTFSPEALAVLQRYPWPLNVRELQQVVERMACLVDGDVVRPEDLPLEVRSGAAGEAAAPGDPRKLTPLRQAVEQTERRHILRALELSGGNRRKAIEILEISPDTFYRRLEEYGLKDRAE